MPVLASSRGRMLDFLFEKTNILFLLYNFENFIELKMNSSFQKIKKDKKKIK